MKDDDLLIRRRIVAVQLGLLSAPLTMLGGPETVELSSSLAAQLALLAAAVAAALVVERGTRTAGVRR